jgi:hypothetical protein
VVKYTFIYDVTVLVKEGIGKKVICHLIVLHGRVDLMLH